MISFYENSIEDSKIIYENLKNEIDWQIKMWNGKPLPRLCCNSAQRFETVSNLLDIIQLFFLNKGITYQFLDVFANYYRNGDDYLPQHSDNYECDVISLSFGATRLFKFSTGEKYYLKSGDIICFDEQQNKISKHGIPKQSQIKDGRINLTIFCKKV